MSVSKLTRCLFWAAEIVLLVGTVGAAVWFSRPEEWHPLALVVLLLVFALVGERFNVEISDGILSASLVSIVLAMGLLGPVPAAACGISAAALHSVIGRRPPARWLSNLSAFAIVPFAGGMMVRSLSDQLNVLHSHQLTQTVVFGLVLFGGFVVVVGLNFVLVGLDVFVEEGRSLRRQLPEFLPLASGELAAGALATILAIAYKGAGLPILFGGIAVLLIFQRLMVALLRSEDRAEHLLARSRQLVGLQLGVLTTLVKALGMRDKTTERHAAAVATYAKALATDLGCSEEERDTVRAAGLLHEIGKFTWPDRVLHAKAIPDEDMEIVKSQPQEAAIIVGALDGYGQVADAILYHRERIDGRGYPAGLIGNEIPLASRILAICSTYDTMAARDSHHPPMTPEEAMTELRQAAGHGQLDSELVERFIALLERKGSTFAQDADFQTELEFERRVQDMAEPSSPKSTSPSVRAQQRHYGPRSSVRRLSG
jgi:HD-GYP domain-containing protein (c-di-GMP phosphodiesterase class II)